MRRASVPAALPVSFFSYPTTTTMTRLHRWALAAALMLNSATAMKLVLPAELTMDFASNHQMSVKLWVKLDEAPAAGKTTDVELGPATADSPFTLDKCVIKFGSGLGEANWKNGTEVVVSIVPSKLQLILDTADSYVEASIKLSALHNSCTPEERDVKVKMTWNPRIKCTVRSHQG